MKSYVPNTISEREEMLKVVGVNTMDDLFSDVPEDMRLKAGLALHDGMSEIEVRREFLRLAKMNNTDLHIFRGAGSYNHYIPSCIPQLLSRSEFYTAYTPYQAEMSQGMLQSIFEYQTFICRLTGMDVSNASVYDGATAAAEAVSMMFQIGRKKKKKVLLSGGLHHEIIEAVKTYAHCLDIEVVIVPLNEKGTTDVEKISELADGASGIIVQNPNFYGCIEDMQAASDAIHAQGGIFTAYVNPMSLGALKRPCDYNADIAIGDAQPLGMPMSFGGPYAGFMACKKDYTRMIPGRITGETRDSEGNRAYVLTLQAREQHIKRQLASSNICSNQMLCAITASIYLACMGPVGMREVAMQNIQKAHYLADGLTQNKHAKLRYNAPFYNEFVIDTDKNPEVINAVLKSKGFMGGLPLGRVIPGDKTGMLWCATEMNSREEIDALICAFEEAVK
ncbi:MAG: aminomethyl-transferring glycine dehydrogenase subunit GcvPA [Clostridia bacterium]|nr:aminomethyl-transferring glycine dehydrogenase subunit GcvPA [Clostridia bacterium]